MPAQKTKNIKKDRLILLDVHAIIHRAYHALPDFSSSKGEPTGALYGLCTMLIKIISELKPDYIAACYDLPEKTYRHEAYEGYKAGRKKADEALVAQLIRSRDVFKAFNIPAYEMGGFEADDMLGTIVEKMKDNADLDIIIASGDMDTLQLVKGKKVQVYTLKKGINDTILYNEAAVRERFGFGPELLPDYKGLRGDPSDNIIGIKGVGEKTATHMICAFGSIEKIYLKLKKDRKAFVNAGIKERMIDLLAENEEEARFSKMLATIRRDAPIDFTLPPQKWRDSLELQPILDLFGQLEFRTLGVRVRDAFSFQQSLMASADQAALASQSAIETEKVDDKELKEASLALWVLDSNINNPSLEDVLQYAKTAVFSQAKEKILAEIEKQGLSRILKDVELPLAPIVDIMEKRGIKIDTGYLAQLSKRYHTELDKLEKKIYELAGEEFNINSPKQLGVILFEKLALTAKNLKKTEGGARSTRESELQKMADTHPIIKLILEHRELQKLLSTYIDNIPNMLDGGSRLHATFSQAGTTTGRMSSNNPNLQNIPIKTELGRNIRNGFIADDDSVLLAFDYSQIELRIAAFLSGDDKLIEIFKKGQDVHTSVAAQVFKVPLDKVDKEMRRKAKVINFGIIYGMGINALKANLGTDRKEAQEFYNTYFENFSGLATYLENIRTFAEHKGYTETLYGRKRYFEGIRSHIPYIKAAAERMAINAPIQGTEADIVKLAMIKVQEYLSREKFDGYGSDPKDAKVCPLLQVHDELVYEARKDVVSKVVPEIIRIMENIVDEKDTRGVPIRVHASQGRSWGEMEDIK